MQAVDGPSVFVENRDVDFAFQQADVLIFFRNGNAFGGLSLLIGDALPLLALGEVALLAIVLAYLATLTVPRLIRREKIEFAWWLAHAEGGVERAGLSFQIKRGEDPDEYAG